MLELYFNHPDRLCDLRQGPLAKRIDDFAAELYKLGYSRSTGRRHLRIVGKFSKFAQAGGIKNAEQIDEKLIERFINRKSISGNMRSDAKRAMRHMLKCIYPIGARPKPLPPAAGAFETMLTRYNDHLRDVRGLSPGTREKYLRGARRFYAWLQTRDKNKPLSALTGIDVLAFITDLVKRHPSGAWRNSLCVETRVFLRYLYWEEIIKVKLDRTVPKVAGWRLGTIPRHLPWEQVRLLIDSVDTSSPVGKRDKAVLLLLSVLGLRNQEVRELKLADIDWRAAEIRLSKTKALRERVLPLTQAVGAALADYILHGRPHHDSPYIFFYHYAPKVPITSTHGIGDIVRRGMRRLGIRAPSYGAHILRHSLATRMVNRGVPIKQIADVLGHVSIDTTAIYTKVNKENLATVALPFPGGAS